MKSTFPLLLLLLYLLSASPLSAQSDHTSYDSKKLIHFLKKPLQDSLTVVERNEKFGIIDSSGKVIIPIKYDELATGFGFDPYGRNWIIREQQLLQLRFLNEYFYDYWAMGNESEEEYARLLKKEQGNPNSFLNRSAEFRSNPIFIAKTGNRCGVISQSNETIIPFEYESLQEAGYDLFLGKKEGRHGIINTKKKTIVPFDCDTIILSFIHPRSILDLGVYALLNTNGEYGIINLFTQQLLLPKYDDLQECRSFPEDFCGCGFSSDWKHFRYGSPRRVPKVHSFNRVLIYRKQQQFGLLHLSSMQEITTELFDSIRFETNKIVSLNGKATFLIEDNTAVHPHFYDAITQLRNYSGQAIFIVEREGSVGALDESGNTLLEIKWQEVQQARRFSDARRDQFIVKKKGKAGVVDAQEKNVIPIRYDSITYTPNPSKRHYTLFRKGKSEIVPANR